MRKRHESLLSNIGKFRKREAGFKFIPNKRLNKEGLLFQIAQTIERSSSWLDMKEELESDGYPLVTRTYKYGSFGDMWWSEKYGVCRILISKPKDGRGFCIELSLDDIKNFKL